MNNANNGINFDNSTEAPVTPVNSFGGTQTGLNSPLLGENQTPVNDKPAVVNNISLNANGSVKEIKVTQNEDNLCPFCGFKINKNNNMCMHCGRILGNANDMKGTMGAPTIEAEQAADYVDLISQNPKPALVTNIIFLVLGIIGIIAAMIILTKPIILLAIFPYAIGIFYSYCIERLLIKANIKWWGYLIPVYNIFIISKLLTNRYAYILWYVIPLLGYSAITGIFAKSILLYFTIVIGVFEIVIAFTMLNKFADRFAANRWLIFFFPYVMIPVMALKERYICY